MEYFFIQSSADEMPVEGFSPSSSILGAPLGEFIVLGRGQTIMTGELCPLTTPGQSTMFLFYFYILTHRFLSEHFSAQYS